MTHSDLDYLWQSYRNGTATPNEAKALLDLLRKPELEKTIKELIKKDIEVLGNYPVPEEDDISSSRIETIFRQVLAGSGKTPVVQIDQYRSAKKTWWFAAAAVVFLFIISQIWFIANKKDPAKNNVIAQQLNNDVQPGTNGAVLTLDNGKQIILDSAHNGIIAQQGNSNIIKQANGVSYQSNANEPEVVYNTMTTPKGRQFSLTLTDGSKVWLNAASSIKFPSAFSGKERKVEVTGEVYFEVAKNASMPFRVSVNDMTVEVLGTHFNINSYADEPSVTTTLLEGAVKVSKGNEIIKLSPNQQSVLDNDGNLLLNKNANTDEIVAWKDGLFHFESADLKTILRQFSRWYDVEVVYEGGIKNRKFFAMVKRNSTLKTVLEMMKDNNIIYRIEGKKLIVKSG